MIQVFHVRCCCWVAAIALAAVALADVLALVFALALALAAVARCAARAAAPAAAPFTVASRRWVTTCHGCKCIRSTLEQGARCSVVPWWEPASLQKGLDSSEVRANVAQPVFFTRRHPVAADAAGLGRMDWALKGSGWPICENGAVEQSMWCTTELQPVWQGLHQHPQVRSSSLALLPPGRRGQVTAPKQKRGSHKRHSAASVSVGHSEIL